MEGKPIFVPLDVPGKQKFCGTNAAGEIAQNWQGTSLRGLLLCFSIFAFFLSCNYHRNVHIMTLISAVLPTVSFKNNFGIVVCGLRGKTRGRFFYNGPPLECGDRAKYNVSIMRGFVKEFRTNLLAREVFAPMPIYPWLWYSIDVNATCEYERQQFSLSSVFSNRGEN